MAASLPEQIFNVLFGLLYVVTFVLCFYYLFGALKRVRQEMNRGNARLQRLNLLLDVLCFAAILNIWINIFIFIEAESKKLGQTFLEFMLNTQWFLYVWQHTVETPGQRFWTSQLYCFMPLWGLFLYVESRRTSFPVVAGFWCSVFNGPAVTAPIFTAAIRDTTLARYYSRFFVPGNYRLLAGFLLINLAVVMLPFYYSGVSFTLLLIGVHVGFLVPILVQWINGELGKVSAFVYDPSKKDKLTVPTVAQAAHQINDIRWVQWGYTFFAGMYVCNYYLCIAQVWIASSSVKDFVQQVIQGFAANHAQITATCDVVLPTLVMIFIFMTNDRFVTKADYWLCWLLCPVVSPPAAWGIFMAVREGRVIESYYRVVQTANDTDLDSKAAAAGTMLLQTAKVAKK